MGFEINAMTTSRDDALRIKTLLEHMGMALRAVPGIPQWQWADVGIRTGYMVMYARDQARGTSTRGAGGARALRSVCSV